jgi:CheY-like chemotaxis protein
MPEMDGFELAEKIKQSPELAGATIMMLSSSRRKEDLERCREVGVSLFLVKPIRQSALFDAILNTLSQHSDGKKGRTVDRPKKKGVTTETQEKGDIDMHPSLKILLAEDNAVNRKLAEVLLRKREWDVVSVTDGQEALTVLEKEKFDLILMDVQMPVMDGFVATHKIRQKEASKGGHIPIIAMTAHAMKGDREKCIEAGMDDYVSKPMKADELYDVIERSVKSVSESADASVGAVDLTKAMDTVDGDKELLKELVGDFLKEMPQHLEELQGVIDRGDAGQVERKAHSLKGNVGIFGAKVAYDLAYDLENRGKESRLEGAEDVFSRLEEEMMKLKVFFSKPEWEKYA